MRILVEKDVTSLRLPGSYKRILTETLAGKVTRLFKQSRKKNYENEPVSVAVMKTGAPNDGFLPNALKRCCGYLECF